MKRGGRIVEDEKKRSDEQVENATEGFYEEMIHEFSVWDRINGFIKCFILTPSIAIALVFMNDFMVFFESWKLCAYVLNVQERVIQTTMQVLFDLATTILINPSYAMLTI